MYAPPIVSKNRDVALHTLIFRTHVFVTKLYVIVTCGGVFWLWQNFSRFLSLGQAGAAIKVNTEEGDQRNLPGIGDHVVAMWGHSKWQYFTGNMYNLAANNPYSKLKRAGITFCSI